MMRRTLLVLAALCIGAPVAALDQMSNIKPDGMPSYNDFKRTARYPFVAPEPTKRKVVEGLKKAKACSTKIEVEALLGKPHWSQVNCPKELNRLCKGTSWTYLLRRNEDSVNMKDVMVEVFFDPNDKAHWIVPSNIDHAKEIGGVREQCA